ncbi:MAG: HEAT repeat domain-containing protein [Chloroflexi bacterium]|nr:HEAT repeat domain-containing protein [Chloroflexota bacterium]
MQDLINALDNVDYDVRQKAKRALLELDKETVAQPLIEAVYSNTQRMCWEAVSLLTQLRESRAIPAFGDVLRSKNPMLAQVAARSLVTFGTCSVPVLVEALEDTANMTRVQIVKALEEIGGHMAVPTLLRLLESTDSSVVRYTTIAALGVLGDERIIPHIERYADDPDHHVQERVEMVLRKLR